ncbi:MAG: OB-fold nucleic acid binding domain-containing protein [Xanthomonadales bacterium]|nr:OB-fold nucleic acid binding domain-containing protein [Xanthomonadales bacterium]
MKSLITMLAICAFLIYTPPIMAAETGPVTGTVVETIESGGYVYIRLEDGTWIAANTFAVSEGDTIQYSGAMEMNDFQSKSLDRTFDSILFVSEAGLADSGAAAKPAMSMAGHGSKDMQSQPAVAVQAPQAGEIKPLADGKTVAGVFADSDQLKEQVVSLNARVIKISKAIMGKNWITLQDGTGTAPDDRLLATSQEVVAPGDLVIVTGTVKTDIDLGYGYQYKVLLEEATFSEGQK